MEHTPHPPNVRIVRLKRDGTRAEIRYILSPKRTSPFKSTGASVQSTAGSRGVRISGSNAGYTTFRGSESTGYSLYSPVSPSLPLPYRTVCHQVSNSLYISPLDPYPEPDAFIPLLYSSPPSCDLSCHPYHSLPYRFLFLCVIFMTTNQLQPSAQSVS